MRNLVLMRFGSHLYGTATPISDTDYKGVFMPDRSAVLLGRIPRSVSASTKPGSRVKNTAEDTDEELYSLHYFMELACEGQTVAIDMLHAPEEMLIESSPIWAELSSRRAEFYTKNLSAFVGYARRQAAKYGIKGSRLAAAKSVVAYMQTLSPRTRLQEVWDQLPEGEHLYKGAHPEGRPERVYQVCGKKLIETAYVEHYLPMLEKFVADYGDRARQAEQNVGIDWKAISHAFRAGFQVKRILTEGGFTFPLPEAPYLLKVKRGEVPYMEAAPALEDLIDGLEDLAEKSSLPEKVDRAKWDDWLAREIELELFP